MNDREITPYQRIAELEREKSLQGLHLATMADVVLGENAEDRSDDTLVREVCKMARELTELRAYLKTGDMPDPQWSKDDIVHMYELAIDERDAANESWAALHRENAALRSTAVELCALARVWATVWHDKLSTESLQRFAELEQQILKKAQP